MRQVGHVEETRELINKYKITVRQYELKKLFEAYYGG
jgi:hypothetical protein